MKKLEELKDCFDAIIERCKEDEYDLEMYLEETDKMLDELLWMDAFWTEGQLDPRWDHRD